MSAIGVSIVSAVEHRIPRVSGTVFEVTWWSQFRDRYVGPARLLTFETKQELPYLGPPPGEPRFWSRILNLISDTFLAWELQSATVPEQATAMPETLRPHFSSTAL